jgi:hypothetical protein
MWTVYIVTLWPSRWTTGHCCVCYAQLYPLQLLAMASQVDSSLLTLWCGVCVSFSWLSDSCANPTRAERNCAREEGAGRNEKGWEREREKERVSENVAWLCWIVYKNTSRALYNIVKKPRFSPRCSSRLNFWLSHQLCPPSLFAALFRKYSLCVAAATLHMLLRYATTQQSYNIYITQQKKVWFQSRGEWVWVGVWG